MKLEKIQHADSVELKKGDALLVIDMQYDFMPGGALPVEDGDTIVPGVNEMMKQFKDAGLPVIFTQDWHTAGHHSFASVHDGKEPYDTYEAHGIGPVLWPDHCVQGSHGAKFHEDLNVDAAQAIVRKGYRTEIDSYSGFLENDHETGTGLDGYLQSRDIKRIFVVGLAFDYCVFYTAADGVDKGYDVYQISDLSLAVGSPEDSVDNAVSTMQDKGVQFVKSEEIKVKKREKVMAA